LCGHASGKQCECEKCVFHKALKIEQNYHILAHERQQWLFKYTTKVFNP
jgi:hypothetical protein